MAAYQTQQINVGSIAAPDVGNVFANFADRLQKQQANQIDMARQMRQDDRQQVLNQRADQEWNRQQGARKTIADITKEYMNAPYAEKFAGNQEVAALDKRVQSMPQSVWENLTPEQATALQEKYENIGQNKEVARTKLMGALMADGNVDYTAANALADDLTKGLMSRADKQAALDTQYKAELDANKAYNDYIGNVNKDTVDIYKAKLDYQKAFGPNSTGGGSGGGSAGPALKEFNAGTTMDDVYKYIEDKDLGGMDSSGGRAKVKALYNDGKGLHPAVILQALQNNTVTGGGLLSDNYINQEGLDQSLVGKKVGQEGLNELVMQLKNRQRMNLADPTRAEYVDPRSITRQVYNSTPDTNKFLSEALKDDRLAFLRTPDEQDKLTKATTPTTTEVTDKKYLGEKMPEGLSYAEKVTWFENRDKVAKGGVGAAYNVEGGKDKGWGRYQMMGSTLDGYRKNFGNFTNEQFKNDPALQDKVFAQYSADNEKSLVNQGIPINDWTKWLAHNLGTGNVKDFLNRNETAGLKDAMKRQSGSPKSIDDYVDKFGNGFTAEELTSVIPRSNRYLPTDDTMTSPANPQVSEILSKVKDIPYTAIKPTLPVDLNKVESSSTIPDKVFQAAKEDYKTTNGGLLDDLRIKQNMMDNGKVSRQEAEKLYKDVQESVRSDNHIAYRNYLTAKRIGGKYQGKSADDWYNELDSKSKAKTYAPVAPLVAAAGPLYGLAVAAGLLPAFTGGVEAAPILGRAMSNNASEKAAELMNVLRSPKIKAGEVQQTKDALAGLAKQYPELRTDIIKFLQNL